MGKKQGGKVLRSVSVLFRTCGGGGWITKTGMVLEKSTLKKHGEVFANRSGNFNVKSERELVRKLLIATGK